MKKRIAFIVMLCLLCCPISVHAAELSESVDSSGAVISTEVPSTHTLSVSADKAAVSFGGETGNAFAVPRLEAFTLQIRADKGYQVKQVLLNGNDVTKAFADGSITLSGIYEAGELTILTEKSSETSGGTSAPSQTGDYSHIWLWILLMLAAGAGIVGMELKRKRK